MNIGSTNRNIPREWIDWSMKVHKQDRNKVMASVLKFQTTFSDTQYSISLYWVCLRKYLNISK